MKYCVFSYNRGIFLRNCIESIEQCAPDSDIVVFDDNSNDPETRKILDEIGNTHTILQPKSDSKHHLGGLYYNMQKALDFYKDEHLICFLQDDTQLVRQVTQADLDHLHQCFDNLPDLGFLHPCFLKYLNYLKGVEYQWNHHDKLYYRIETPNKVGSYFSALLITNPKKLNQIGWKFAGSEPQNNLQAKSRFQPMGYLYSPFAMWLPEAPAYRGKRKTLGLRLAEKKRKCGYYPFKIMTEQESRQFNHRPVDQLPYAEQFLECENYTPQKPWAYNPLSGTGWMKNLNQLEVSIHRLLKR